MIDTSTMVNSKVYNRLPLFREEIKNKLRSELLRLEKETEIPFDWNTEKIEAIEITKSKGCGCGHNMVVIMSVEYLTQ